MEISAPLLSSRRASLAACGLIGSCKGGKAGLMGQVMTFQELVLILGVEKVVMV